MINRMTATVAWAIAVAALAGTGAALRAAPAPAAVSSLKTVLAEELVQIEREIAALMMKRFDQTGNVRLRTELLIDLRIIRRVMTHLVADARPETPEQALAWLRLKQITLAARGLEEVSADAAWAPTASQKEAMGLLHKLSFSVAEIKGPRELDEFGRTAAVAMVNIANSTPVDIRSLPVMRPRPQGPVTKDPVTPDRPATVTELVQQIQQLASISVPLRQQLLELAQAASQEKEHGPLYGMLTQSIGLARGLQANTAVSAENRAAIETQLAEGLALYSDARTRDAGKSRIESLGTYRQVLTRIGKMGLSREQLQQMSQGLAWASAAGEPGMKYLTSLERFMDVGGRWDRVPREGALATVKKPLDDLGTQFAKQRGTFVQMASRAAPPVDELATQLDEMNRICEVASDIAAMGGYIETLNVFKPRPAGALERKITTSAIAAAAPARTTARNDAEKFLNSVQQVATRARNLAMTAPTDIPPAVSAAWAGGKLDAFETRVKNLIGELTNSLLGPTVDLDKAKLGRLDSAMTLRASLRDAAQLEAALPKAPALARWVDWSIEPQILSGLAGSHRDALAAAFAGYVADAVDPVDRWGRIAGRFYALATLVVRNAVYADQCQGMPIGLGGDLSRLASKLEGEPFGTERFASYAIGMWSMYDRVGDTDAADRIATALARRIARDLHLPITIDDGRPRRGR